MVEYQRLVDYINNYFPDPSKSSQSDIRKWAKKKVPAWKNFSKDTKDGIIDDWKKFVNPPDASKIPSFDRPRGKDGRFVKVKKKVDNFVSPKARSTPKRFEEQHPRGKDGRFTKVADKIKQFLGRRY